MLMLPDVFDAFHAQAVPSICASLAIVIFISFSVGAPVEATTLGLGQVFPDVDNAPSPEIHAVAHEGSLHDPGYAHHWGRGRCSMPRLVT
jgi:hypothetical protein